MSKRAHAEFMRKIEDKLVKPGAGKLRSCYLDDLPNIDVSVNVPGIGEQEFRIRPHDYVVRYKGECYHQIHDSGKNDKWSMGAPWFRSVCMRFKMAENSVTINPSTNELRILSDGTI